MDHVLPNDDDVTKYVGRKIKINRGDEEFVGEVMGVQEAGAKRAWVIKAANLSTTFLPSEGWDVYLCETDIPEELIPNV